MNSANPNETTENEEGAPEQPQTPARRKRNSLKLAWSKVRGGSRSPTNEDHPHILQTTNTRLSSSPTASAAEGSQPDGQQRNSEGIPVYATRQGYRHTGRPLTDEQWGIFFAQEKELEEARSYIVRTGTALGFALDWETVRTLETRVAAQAEVFTNWRRRNFGEGEFVIENGASVVRVARARPVSYG